MLPSLAEAAFAVIDASTYYGGYYRSRITLAGNSIASRGTWPPSPISTQPPHRIQPPPSCVQYIGQGIRPPGSGQCRASLRLDLKIREPSIASAHSTPRASKWLVRRGRYFQAWRIFEPERQSYQTCKPSGFPVSRCPLASPASGLHQTSKLDFGPGRRELLGQTKAVPTNQACQAVTLKSKPAIYPHKGGDGGGGGGGQREQFFPRSPFHLYFADPVAPQ